MSQQQPHLVELRRHHLQEDRGGVRDAAIAPGRGGVRQGDAALLRPMEIPSPCPGGPSALLGEIHGRRPQLVLWRLDPNHEAQRLGLGEGIPGQGLDGQKHRQSAFFGQHLRHARRLRPGRGGRAPHRARRPQHCGRACRVGRGQVGLGRGARHSGLRPEQQRPPSLRLVQGRGAPSTAHVDPPGKPRQDPGVLAAGVGVERPQRTHGGCDPAQHGPASTRLHLPMDAVVLGA